MPETSVSHSRGNHSSCNVTTVSRGIWCLASCYLPKTQLIAAVFITMTCTAGALRSTCLPPYGAWSGANPFLTSKWNCNIKMWSFIMWSWVLLACWDSCLSSFSLQSFRRFGNAFSEFFQQLQPWHKTLKIIGAEFGTSVLSYFVFLKWLLNFNIFSFLINCGFITIPQFLAAEPNNLSFTGLELLTGAVSIKFNHNCGFMIRNRKAPTSSNLSSNDACYHGGGSKYSE